MMKQLHKVKLKEIKNKRDKRRKIGYRLSIYSQLILAFPLASLMFYNMLFFSYIGYLCLFITILNMWNMTYLGLHQIETISNK